MNFSSNNSNITLFGAGLKWPDQDLLLALVEMDNRFFPRPWSLESWQNLKQKSADYLLAVSKSTSQKLEGYALWKLSQAEGLSHLLKIYVEKDLRRSGMGKNLFNASQSWLCSQGLNKIYLEVEEENLPAQDFYRGLGLEMIHYQKHHYSDGKGAFIMGQNLVFRV